MRAAVDETFTLTKDNTRFSFLNLGTDFHGLIDHPKVGPPPAAHLDCIVLAAFFRDCLWLQVLPLLQELIGPKLRLDHTYGMGM